jgi:hypothetical protein
MDNLASNRQRKLLRFFGVRFSPNITDGAAGWEIANLLADERCHELWSKYLYVTRDFDSDTDQLKPFDLVTLETVVIPEDWDVRAEIQQFRALHQNLWVTSRFLGVLMLK